MKNQTKNVETAATGIDVGTSACGLSDLSFEETPLSSAAQTEIEKRMLLFRLSEASIRIRDESNLIRRTTFTDPSGRLLRILGETVEEQKQALKGVGK